MFLEFRCCIDRLRSQSLAVVQNFPKEPLRGGSLRVCKRPAADINAGTSGDKNAIPNRDEVAEEMTRAEIAESQALAQEWMEKYQ